MNEKNEDVMLPEVCPECGGHAFWRKFDEEQWLCCYCDPPADVKLQDK
jgi:hypothetical protein